MAIKLREKEKVRILIPFWMEIDFLKSHLRREKEFSESLMELPYYFFEIMYIMFQRSPKELKQIEIVKALISDIEAIRNEKINNIIKSIKNQKYIFTTENICAKEMEIIRPFVCEVLNSSEKLFNLMNEN